MSKKAIFKVDGMSCMGCVNAVKNAIHSVSGIIRDEVSLDEGKAVVEFDDNQISVEEIEKALKETPYTIALIATE
jgi:copper chaperone